MSESMKTWAILAVVVATLAVVLYVSFRPPRVAGYTQGQGPLPQGG